jgi:hypothetical protein
MNAEQQEADLTLWANGVAEVLDDRQRPELAAVFRALARRDGEAVRQAMDLFPPTMLEALAEMVELERRDRADAGQERAVEILDWLANLVEEVHDEHRTVDLDPDGAGPVQ